MKIEIINQTKFRLPSIKNIKASINFFKKALVRKKILNVKLADQKLLVVFVSSLEIRKLNKKFLKK
ncbi:MAG: hypothetical protein OXC37_04550, partial [Bdellovibrionaceae bacterium]|nr:hypothetical protein [Pseudobdellovibrionaceae bacterium]